LLTYPEHLDVVFALFLGIPSVYIRVVLLNFTEPDAFAFVSIISLGFLQSILGVHPKVSFLDVLDFEGGLLILCVEIVDSVAGV
jgi:hypothetical protein